MTEFEKQLKKERTQLKRYKTRCKNLSADLKKEKAHWEAVIEQLVRDQADELVMAFKQGYKKGDMDKDAIYAKAFSECKIKSKVLDRIVAKVKKYCLAPTAESKLELKAGDYKPVYK